MIFIAKLIDRIKARILRVLTVPTKVDLAKLGTARVLSIESISNDPNSGMSYSYLVHRGVANSKSDK